MYEVVLHFAKSPIECGDNARLQRPVNFILGQPELFRFEHLDSQLDIKRSMLRFAKEGRERTQHEQEVKLLESKVRLLTQIKDWRQELVIGLASYVLMQMDGKGAEKSQASRKEQLEMLSFLLAHLPRTFFEVLEIHKRFQRDRSDERWGWEWWEIKPGAGPKWMEYSHYTRRVFALLILRSATKLPSDEEVRSLEMDTSDTHDFSVNSGTIRSYIAPMKSIAAELGVPGLNSNEETDVDSFFERLIRFSQLNSDLHLVRKPLSHQRISEFVSQFDNCFVARARVRKLLGITPVESTPPELYWGINKLVMRECFVDDPAVSFPDPGQHYATDLALSEDGFLLGQIVGLLAPQDSTIASLVRDLRGKGCRQLIILVERDPYFLRALRSDPSFVARWNLKENPRDADGLYQVDGEQVPLFHISRNDDEPNNAAVVVTEASNIILERHPVPADAFTVLPESGFGFSLIDPKTDERLKADWLKNPSDWLREFPEEHRRELVGKFVWLRVLQKMTVKLKEKDRTLLIKVETEE